MQNHLIRQIGTDDLISEDNVKFGEYVPQIYPKELILKKTNIDDKQAEYLDLQINIREDGRIETKLYDKRDDFNFEIVNCPYLDSNIPLGPAYGVYISQLVRYSRVCCNYEDFKVRHLILVQKLLKQSYEKKRLRKAELKFHHYYNNFVHKS